MTVSNWLPTSAGTDAYAAGPPVAKMPMTGTLTSNFCIDLSTIVEVFDEPCSAMKSGFCLAIFWIWASASVAVGGTAVWPRYWPPAFSTRALIRSPHS